jgi:acyl-CoA dehydrogenase
MTSLIVVAGACGWVVLMVAYTPWRRRWLTRPLLGRFRQVLPQLSPTEQQALDAGTVGWDGELFAGRPDWSRLLSTPAPQLSAAEQAFIDGPLQTL